MSMNEIAASGLPEITFPMTDWHDESATDQRPWSVKVKHGEKEIYVFATCPDGNTREIWIEISDGNLVAHCYDPEHDEPINVRISKADTTTDTDR